MDLVLTHNSLAVSAPGGQRSQARVTSWTSLEIQLSPLQERHQFAAGAKSLQSCPTLCDPIRRQPTRLPRPWDLLAALLKISKKRTSIVELINKCDVFINEILYSHENEQTTATNHISESHQQNIKQKTQKCIHNIIPFN